MSCCDESTARVPRFDLSRRSVLKGTVVVASMIFAVHPTASDAQEKRIKLAY
jgi:NitT/TauT family transport system substrate-binding protein